MLTKEELRKKAKAFIIDHADTCYQVETFRKKVVYATKLKYLIAAVAFICLLGLLAFWSQLILLVFILPMLALFITPFLLDRKPILRLPEELKATLFRKAVPYLFPNLTYTHQPDNNDLARILQAAEHYFTNGTKIATTEAAIHGQVAKSMSKNFILSFC